MQTTWHDYITAIGAIATPVLVLALTAIGWRIRTRIERQTALEDRLREDRIATYNAILKPFILLLTTDAAWESDPKNKGKNKNDVALRMLLAVDYREQGFRMTLVGSDAVVKSYNNLMQYFYQRANRTPVTDERELRLMLELLGTFLLEIRRSMGNEASGLTNWDMLEWWMADARRLRLLPTPEPAARSPNP